MAFDQDKVMTALAIRDTSNHNTGIADLRNFTPKTIIVQNGLNQQVTITAQGDQETGFGKPVTIGSSFNIAATTNGYQTLDDFFPFLRLVVACTTAPTTGDITIYVEKN